MLTDHYFKPETLDEIGRFIAETGEMPTLPEDFVAGHREEFRRSADALRKRGLPPPDDTG